MLTVYKCVACGMVLNFLPTDKHCPLCKTRIKYTMQLDPTLIPIDPENVSDGNVSSIDPNIKD